MIVTVDALSILSKGYTVNLNLWFSRMQNDLTSSRDHLLVSKTAILLNEKADKKLTQISI